MPSVRTAAGALAVAGLLAGLGFPARADTFQFTPAISLQEVYTSNSGGGTNGLQSDVVTQISPGIGIAENGPWSTVMLNYSPTYNHYDFGTSPDRIDQSLNATATVTPFEHQLQIDFSAYASEAGAALNSNNLSNSLLVASNNRVLYYLGSVIPHFTHRFGDVATVDAYYRLKSANVSDESIGLASGPSLSSDTLENDAEVIVGSGESFGRVSAQLDFDHDVGSGSGQNANSNNDKDFLSAQYHLNNDYALIGSVGYQRVHYDATSGSVGFNNEGAIWSLGVRATPNSDSTLTVSYGLQEGIYVPTVQMTYALGPRTQIAASYLVAVQNQLEYALNNLQYLSYDSLGNPIDTRTGLPFSLVNQSFGSQNVLFRDKPAQLTVTHQLERSAISIRLVYEERSAVTGVPATDRVAGGDVSYSRDFSPITNGSIDLGFINNSASGVLSNGNNRANILSLTFSLSWALSKSATVYFNGTLYEPLTKPTALETTTNQATIGFRKAF